MANIQKKVISKWDDGITTSNRSSDPVTSNGAQMIKNFDIYRDPKKLVPMQNWEDFTTDAEKAYGIVAMGGVDSPVYGLGTYSDNWIGLGWNYRIKITPDSTAHSPLWFDLSLLGSTFWDNVNEDLTDVRITTSENRQISFHIENIDFDNQTGDLWIDSSSGSTYYYIYYGNSSVTSFPPYGSSASQLYKQQINTFQPSSLRFAYTFGDNKAPNKYYSDGATGSTEAFTTDPLYHDGLVGKSITTPVTLSTDADDDVGFAGARLSISFLVKFTSFPGGGSQVNILEDLSGYWYVAIDSAGKIRFFINGTGGNTEVTSTTVLSVDTWYVIDCVFDDDHSIYINSVVETFNTNDGNYDGNASNDTVLIRTNTGVTNICYISNVFGYIGALTQAFITSKYNNYTDAGFWNIDTYENVSDINLIYTGKATLYYKSLTSGDWLPYQVSDSPLRFTKYPVNAFVGSSGTYYILANSTNTTAFYYVGAEVDGDIDEEYLSLGTFIQSFSKHLIQQTFAQTTSTDYFNNNSSVAEYSTPDSSVFVAGSTIQSMAEWKKYLALGYNSRRRGFMSLWDLVNTQDSELVDLGTGNVRIIGNTADTLFAVVDNFSDSAVSSSNRPTMEIRQYLGNGETRTTHVIDIFEVVTDYDDYWERAVSNFKINRNREVLFYARLAKSDTEFNEGFWSVGLNTDGRLSLTLQIDTEGLGMPMNVFGFAQQVFFIQKDGGIKKLSDSDYSRVSLFQTLKMNEGNTNISKDLKGVEIITEPLEANQVITIYYKTDTDADRVKIGEFSGEGEISKEFLYDDAGDNLNNYKEVEFYIESTGGKSAVLEFNYKYEYLNNII